ncbi:S1 RNA-binding domain-containing protein [Plantactinospora veratri]|uniref:S1 RNA-binding domain-containing protein n=1 Tax=Plantactinospora veratri TaxID=1436122 RepID=UPI002F263684
MSLETLQRGQVVRGAVVEIENFGVFVEIGGVVGMVNCPELSWTRFDHPSHVVSVGDRLTVLVLDVDLDRERVSLSLKGLLPDPLAEFARTRLGTVVPGTVTRVVPPLGVFFAIGDGIEGLVHNTVLDRTCGLGDVFAVEIVDINLVNRRVRLVPTDRQPS